MAVPETNTPDWLAELAADWYQAARPLLLIDEVRLPDATVGDIVSFVVLGTDTRVAHGLATAASEIRGRASAADAASLIKGSTLFGQRRRGAHDPFRDYVVDALRRCASRTRVTTSGSVLKRYQLLAPGGIRLEAAPGEQAPVEAIRGRELVPVMNTLKIVANTQGFGANQVDVLLDRSAQLGLDRPVRCLARRSDDSGAWRVQLAGGWIACCIPVSESVPPDLPPEAQRVSRSAPLARRPGVPNASKRKPLEAAGDAGSW